MLMFIREFESRRLQGTAVMRGHAVYDACACGWRIFWTHARANV
jgi:hypothetical protein